LQYSSIAYSTIQPHRANPPPRKGEHRVHSDTQHFDHFYKSKQDMVPITYSNNIVILTGDAGVGKSNFLLRYIHGLY